MVIDFAVEDDPDRLVFISERLMAAGHVDDRQSPMAEGDAWQSTVARQHFVFTGVAACIVRAAVTQHIGHARERLWLDCQKGVAPDAASDSAHALFRSFELILSDKFVTNPVVH